MCQYFATAELRFLPSRTRTPVEKHTLQKKRSQLEQYGLRGLLEARCPLHHESAAQYVKANSIYRKMYANLMPTIHFAADGGEHDDDDDGFVIVA